MTPNKLLGVGLVGNQIVERISHTGLKDTASVACDMDANDLAKISIEHKILLGNGIMNHLSIESQAEIGMQAVTKSALDLATYVAIDGFEQFDTLFNNHSKAVTLIARLNDPTVTGAAPVIAQIAKKSTLFVTAIVFTPFDFEGEITKKLAVIGLRKLRADCDCVLVIQGAIIRKLYGNLSFKRSFERSADIAFQLAKTVLQVENRLFFKSHNDKPLFIGIGESTGAESIIETTELAMLNPLCERANIEDVSHVLVQINEGSYAISVEEKTEIKELVFKYSETSCVVTISESAENSSAGPISAVVLGF
jgi:cell division protein FtsZ